MSWDVAKGERRWRGVAEHVAVGLDLQLFRKVRTHGLREPPRVVSNGEYMRITNCQPRDLANNTSQNAPEKLGFLKLICSVGL